MPLLDAMIYGVRDVIVAGVRLTRRSRVAVGAGLAAFDDDANDWHRLDVVAGACTVDMADADLTPTDAQAACGMIENGNAVAMTADRTLFLPNATDAAHYVRYVRNANGAGANVVVQDVAAGTTVTIADGFGAWVGIRATGAFRLSADVAN